MNREMSLLASLTDVRESQDMFYRTCLDMRNANPHLAFSVTLSSSPNRYPLYARRPKQSWLEERNKKNGGVRRCTHICQVICARYRRHCYSLILICRHYIFGRWSTRKNLEYG